MAVRVRLLLRAAILLALAACLLVAFDGLRDRLGPADVGVVLGSRVDHDGRPSRRLAARFDRAAELHRRGLFPIILVSGGIEPEGHDEAQAMRDYLVAHGVAPDRIALDHHGDNTRLTARHTNAWLEAHGGRSAMAISQHFHLPRCRLAFAKAGIVPVYSAHARVWEWRDLYSTPRDVVGLLTYAMGLRER
jgi:uncharacterized SAM-binding protein YcdF (DUF218 family)